MSHFGNNENPLQRGEPGSFGQQEYPKKVHYSQEGPGRYEVRSFNVEQNYYDSNAGKVEATSRNSYQVSAKHPEQHRKPMTEAPDGRSRYTNSNGRSDGAHVERQYRPTTGQMRSGHVELDSLYSGSSAPVQVNAMNAPNNSTIQCGCENIDCPFCNLMLSVEMKQ